MSKQKLYDIFQNPGIKWRGKSTGYEITKDMLKTMA